ncbi:MAG: hypothetical protein ACKVY0_00195 [Prosthecobacter sp.]|uniref:hypothetical protein n=1 Tax=Prosthecobacter sp. TaxID=1965333 RepID=UPI003900A01F
MKHVATLVVSLLIASLNAFAEVKDTPRSNGLAPEVPGLNLNDKLYQLEAKLPDLEKPAWASLRG